MGTRDSVRKIVSNRRTLVNVLGISVLLAAVAPFLVIGVPQLAGASESYVVMSDSMSPTFESGDVILVEDVDPETVEEGDVITYADGSGERTTHRVVDVVEEDGELYFQTKGDANEDPDQGLVPADAVEARHVHTLPYIGHVVLFAGSRLGIVLLMIVPGTLLMVSEAWNLYRAWNGSGGDGGDADSESGADEPPAGPQDLEQAAPEPAEDD